jgi:hypothetical protein
MEGKALRMQKQKLAVALAASWHLAASANFSEEARQW